MAAIAHSKPNDNDESFQSLYKRFNSLETELNIMQEHSQIVCTYHGQQCILSLSVSMTTLFEVIGCVKKADKALVDWYYRNKYLKLIGMDRRARVYIEGKIQKLKNKVSAVELQCSEASGDLGGGVEATARLRQDFVTFLVDSVGEVSKEAIQTRDVYDEDRKQVQSKIMVQEIEHQDVSIEVASTQESLTQLRERSDLAGTIRDVCTLGSYGSLGLAAATAAATFLFPLSLAATAPLVAFGVTSAGVATSYDQEVHSFKLQQEELNRKLVNQESLVEALKDEIGTLNLEHQKYTKTVQMIEELQDKTVIIRAEVQKTLDRLRHAQMVLNRILIELDAMREQLEGCQYAKTRGDIARKLGEIVMSMQNVSGNGVLVQNQQKVSDAMHALAEIDQKTKEVVEIASLAWPNSS